MKNYKLSISYDGSNFHGFQIQKDKKTIQGEFQKALEIFTDDYELNYSGRTDAGVHAKAQILSVKTHLKFNHKIINSMNKILGDEISINSFKPTTNSFHPRYDAIQRTYKYFVSDNKQNYPYLKGQSFLYSKELDIKKLNEVSNLFLGEHNFSAFSKTTTNQNPNREIFKSQWAKKRDYFEYTVIGNSFLRNMVRNLVGAQIAYIESKISYNEIIKYLDNPKKQRVNHIAPPYGLVLWNVKY
jgi:tRNA pseudouridine38-40 synthase